MEKINDVAYKLKLLQSMRIHPVFQVSLLTAFVKPNGYQEPVNPDLIVVEGEFEFEVEKILASRKGKAGTGIVRVEPEIEITVSSRNSPVKRTQPELEPESSSSKVKSKKTKKNNESDLPDRVGLSIEELKNLCIGLNTFNYDRSKFMKVSSCREFGFFRSITDERGK